MQNVIDSVYVYPDLRSVRLPRGLRWPDDLAMDYVRLSDNKRVPVTAQILVIEAIAGGDVVCVCEGIKIEQSSTE
jgi:hypothetical protein